MSGGAVTGGARHAAPLVPLQLPADAGFDAWLLAARRLLAQHVPPERVLWGDNAPLLPAGAGPSDDYGGDSTGRGPHVPATFFNIAESAACFRDPGRWALLYRVLWRLTHGEPRLLELELTEPSLFLAHASGSTDDLAVCLAHRFVEQSAASGRVD